LQLLGGGGGGLLLGLGGQALPLLLGPLAGLFFLAALLDLGAQLEHLFLLAQPLLLGAQGGDLFLLDGGQQRVLGLADGDRGRRRGRPGRRGGGLGGAHQGAQGRVHLVDGGVGQAQAQG